MTAFTQSLAVFFQFLKRDVYAKRQSFIDNAVNYVCIYPIVFAVQSAYLQAHTIFPSTSPQFSTIFFAGNILLVMLLFTYKQNIELLFDLENQRYIDYQITVLSPFLVLCERILFTGLYTFVLTIPYYPVGGLLLPKYIDLSHTNWIHLLLILCAGSFCLSAYHLLAAVTLNRSTNIGSLWSRVNGVLILLGGFWIPLYIMRDYSPILGKIVFLNPCIYLTEGIKRAITGSNQFLPFSLCLPMLLLFTFVFTGLCWYQFKRRVDCL